MERYNWVPLVYAMDVEQRTLVIKIFEDDCPDFIRYLGLQATAILIVLRRNFVSIKVWSFRRVCTNLHRFSQQKPATRSVDLSEVAQRLRVLAEMPTAKSFTLNSRRLEMYRMHPVARIEMKDGKRDSLALTGKNKGRRRRLRKEPLNHSRFRRRNSTSGDKMETKLQKF